ncbi:type I secretion system permease/ATPase [Magnetococcales bacterium HHB-1]
MSTSSVHPTTLREILHQAIHALRRGFFRVGLFSLGINLLLLTSPIFMMQVFDRVLSSQNLSTLLMLTLIAGIAILTLALLEWARSLVLNHLGSWLERQFGGLLLKGEILRTINQETSGQVQALRDLSTVRQFLSGRGILAFMDAPWTPIFLLVLFGLDPLLGWVALVGALILFTLALMQELSTKPLSRQASVKQAHALGEATSAIHNAHVIEAMGMMPAFIERWHQRFSESVLLHDQANQLSGRISAISKFVRFFLQIAILATGAYLVITHRITSGSMVASSILLGRALAPVEQAIGHWRTILAARASYQNLEKLLDATPMRGLRAPLPKPKGVLQVEKLSFAYPDQENLNLRSISFRLNAGESMGLIGSSAAGKSTLGYLLVGNFTPLSGHVRLDGMDISKWEPEDRGQYVGYLPQSVELFRGTVRENIAKLQPDQSEKVVEAARLSRAHNMIMRLAQGYDTEIGSGGRFLSSGQKQRIGLARAVYGLPALVILDEPNANLDSDGEQALIQCMTTLKNRRVTTILIAHRPSLIRHVDKILVLKQGEVRLFGPREEVLKKLREDNLKVVNAQKEALSLSNYHAYR